MIIRFAQMITRSQVSFCSIFYKVRRAFSYYLDTKAPNLRSFFSLKDSVATPPAFGVNPGRVPSDVRTYLSFGYRAFKRLFLKRASLLTIPSLRSSRIPEGAPKDDRNVFGHFYVFCERRERNIHHATAFAGTSIIEYPRLQNMMHRLLPT